MGNSSSHECALREEDLARLTPSRSRCWIVEPDGCPRTDAPASTTWREDVWGASHGYDGPIGCARRQRDVNAWCGTAATLTHYGPSAPPAVATAVATTASTHCWIQQPSGCPDGDGAAPSTAWRRDDWGAANGYDGRHGCKRRERDLERWCGVDDVLTHYDTRAPRSP